MGTVTTGEPGTDASVINSGTETDAIFDFTIPRGADGTGGSGGGAEIGEIRTYGQKITNSNYLLCDGTVYTNTDYPTLAAKIADRDVTKTSDFLSENNTVDSIFKGFDWYIVNAVRKIGRTRNIAGSWEMISPNNKVCIGGGFHPTLHNVGDSSNPGKFLFVTSDLRINITGPYMTTWETANPGLTDANVSYEVASGGGATVVYNRSNSSTKGYYGAVMRDSTREWTLFNAHALDAVSGKVRYLDGRWMGVGANYIRYTNEILTYAPIWNTLGSISSSETIDDIQYDPTTSKYVIGAHSSTLSKVYTFTRQSPTPVNIASVSRDRGMTCVGVLNGMAYFSAGTACYKVSQSGGGATKMYAINKNIEALEVIDNLLITAAPSNVRYTNISDQKFMVPSLVTPGAYPYIRAK